MKNFVLIAGIILFAAVLLGAGNLFMIPAENSISKPLKIMEYKQEGQFGYEVTARPSYFYNETPASAPETSPQIPIKFIESLNMDYEYHSSATADEKVAINAVLENPGAWKKTVNLVPPTTVKSGSAISFNLDINYFQGLAETIEKEIGVMSSARDLTLQAVVSGGGKADFVHSLPVKMTKTYLKIDDVLTASGSGREGRFNYRVKLLENSLFGAVTLTPPAAADIPAKVLGPEDTVFIKFIDSMKVNFSYKLTASKAVREVQEEVIIEAVLESPGKWSKTYTLAPPSRQNGDFTVSFPLDLEQYNNIFDAIQQETGVSTNARNLTLNASLHTTAVTDSGKIDKTFTQSITTNLRDSLLTWSGDLKKSEPGSIEVANTVKEKATLLGIPVMTLRIITIALAAVLASLLGLSLWRRIRNPQPANTRFENETRGLNQKYKELLIQVRELPELKSGQSRVQVNSFGDLIKVSQGIMKPIHHLSDGDRHLYWVNDEFSRYEYTLTPPAEEYLFQPKNTGETANPSEE